jgi:hypothetical protein
MDIYLIAAWATIGSFILAAAGVAIKLRRVLLVRKKKRP